jgi:hypothetical protein
MTSVELPMAASVTASPPSALALGFDATTRLIPRVA